MHVTGILISGPTASNGIEANSSIANVSIDNVIISDIGGNGITFSNVDRDIVISHVLIDNTDGHGIHFGSGTHLHEIAVQIRDSFIEDTGGSGILFNQVGAEVSDTTVRNATLNSFTFHSDNLVTFTRVTADTAGGSGFELAGLGNIVTIDTSALTGAFARGISVTGPTNKIYGSGNVASGASFLDQFCSTSAVVSGEVAFDVGTCP